MGGVLKQSFLQSVWARLVCLLCLPLLTSCASEAFSLGAPNVVYMTAQPSIIAIGETVRIDLYAQQSLPEGALGEIRTLTADKLQEIGLTVIDWTFRSAFDFSITVAVGNEVDLLSYELELPIENEFEEFLVRFDLQVVR